MSGYFPSNGNWWRKAVEKAGGPMPQPSETEVNKDMALLRLAKAVASCEVLKAYGQINVQKLLGSSGKVQ